MKTRGFLKEMWTSQGQELSLLLYSPNSGVNEVKWSSVTHCMTSSWPAVATKTTARVSPAMHTRYFYARCHSCHNPPYFRALGPTHNMPACVSWGRLGCLWYYVILISWDHFYCILADKVGNNRCFTDNRWAICLQIALHVARFNDLFFSIITPIYQAEFGRLSWLSSGRSTSCTVADASCWRPAARSALRRNLVDVAAAVYPQREADACRSDRISRGSFSNYRWLDESSAAGDDVPCVSSGAVIWLDIDAHSEIIYRNSGAASYGPLIAPQTRYT